MDDIRGGDWADCRAHLLLELVFERVGVLLAGVERHVRVDALALDVVRETNDRGLGYLGV